MADVDGRVRAWLAAFEPEPNGLERTLERRRRRDRNRRVLSAGLAMVIAASGLTGAYIAFRPGSEVVRDRGFGPTASAPAGSASDQYSVILPGTPRGVDEQGRLILDADTNLPEGTIVELYQFSADAESPGQSAVAEGLIEIRNANNLCHETEVGLIGTTVEVSVEVRAEYPSFAGRAGRPGASPVPPRTQPREVQEVLGPHFERLVGEQVREADGERYLQTSRVFELSADTCSSKLVYTGGGSFEQVPVERDVHIDTGPFPRAPFTWCPDVHDALPVEAGHVESAGVARAFDIALQASDLETLSELADPSVQSYEVGWHATGSADPQVLTNVPSGFYIPEVPDGCGSLVALRTWGVVLAEPAQEGTVDGTTYLLVLRPEGWRVWGSVKGSG